MKLVLVGPAHPLRGGIAHYNSSLYRELSSRQEIEDAVVLSFTQLYPNFLFPGTTQFDSGDDPFNVGARALIDPFRPASWRRAARAILQTGARAVLFQWWHSICAPAYRSIASRLAAGGVAGRVLCCHNVFPHERPPRLLQPLERLLVASMLGHFTGAVVHSEQERGRLAGVAPGLATVQVPHPAYDFYSRWARGAKPPDGTLRLLYFGTVRPYKGLDIFLKALPGIAAETPVRMTIAGEFYVSEVRMRAIAEAGGVTSLIDWRNRYIPNPEVAELFEDADLVVVPYVRATQSGVIGVACEFGVPVVASDIAGLSESVRPGITGELVAAGDPDALAEAILDFHRRGGACRYRKGIEELRGELTWSRVADGILSLVARDGNG